MDQKIIRITGSHSMETWARADVVIKDGVVVKDREGQAGREPTEYEDSVAVNV